MSRIIRLAMLCCVAFAACEGTADACSCALRPVCAAFWDADRVFTGLAEVTASGKAWQTTRFRVEESFRGSAGVVEIVARGIGGSCAYAFVHGTRYLVFARRAPDGTWSALYCDPTAPLDQAGEGLAFARAVGRDTRRGGSLSGSVSVVERASDGQIRSTSPLSGATIFLRGEAREFTAETDSKGQYSLNDIAPGHYTLRIRAPSAVEPGPARIEIKGPGACATHVVTISRSSSR